MGESVEIVVDGERVRVSEGMTLASALMDAGVIAFRVSVSGAPRAPICGMGSCFECRVTVNGRQHQRSCLIPCAEGMVVETGSGAGRGDAE
ncbi:MAG TPA: (2Fe-2S)-binding protein [Gemmatimonadaceae bacterium]|nr:(2Fe-2S)-binding protein [Gemmatimonadaceae bacterium]